MRENVFAGSIITAIPLLETPGRPREADPRVEYFTVMRRPDHVTDARAEQSKSAQNKKSGTEITHYRRPRPKPVDPPPLLPGPPVSKTTTYATPPTCAGVGQFAQVVVTHT